MPKKDKRSRDFLTINTYLFPISLYWLGFSGVSFKRWYSFNSLSKRILAWITSSDDSPCFSAKETISSRHRSILCNVKDMFKKSTPHLYLYSKILLFAFQLLCPLFMKKDFLTKYIISFLFRDHHILQLSHICDRISRLHEHY